jgi:hypothetical protein
MFFDNIETKIDMFESYKQNYGYKYKIEPKNYRLNHNLALKRNGNCITLDNKFNGELKIGDYILRWNYNPKVYDNFKKFTRPKLYNKHNQVIADNITGILKELKWDLK